MSPTEPEEAFKQSEEDLSEDQLVGPQNPVERKKWLAEFQWPTGATLAAMPPKHRARIYALFSEAVCGSREEQAERSRRIAEHRAARKAEWDAKSPEEQDELCRQWDQERRTNQTLHDEFAGMDEDDADFLRDWLG